ncbi:MAG: hypothetical protein WBB17_04595 [Saprospiraceae bacterium]|jgi:hypothetical protein
MNILNFFSTFASIPINLRNIRQNWAMFQSAPLISASEIVIPNWSPPLPNWPISYFGNNTCFGIGIRIFYRDSNFCEFEEWNCKIIG